MKRWSLTPHHSARRSRRPGRSGPCRSSSWSALSLDRDVEIDRDHLGDGILSERPRKMASRRRSIKDISDAWGVGGARRSSLREPPSCRDMRRAIRVGADRCRARCLPSLGAPDGGRCSRTWGCALRSHRTRSVSASPVAIAPMRRHGTRGHGLPGAMTKPAETGPAGLPRRDVEATTGFEPVNRGFADLRVEPLHHVARCGSRDAAPAGCWLPLEDSNLGSRIQSPLSYH